MKNKILIFGAGNIGRAVLGHIFSRGGYAVVFVDIDTALVEALNQTHHYHILIKRDHCPDQACRVEYVCGVHANDLPRVISEISDASLVATAVGKQALPTIIPTLAQGLERRYAIFGPRPLDIILAENFRQVVKFFHAKLCQYLPVGFDVNRLVGLVQASVGKVVPLMKAEERAGDPLLILTEAETEFILDRHGFKTPLPPLPEVTFQENITAYVDRKLFLLNLGHAAAAYLGHFYYPEHIYLHDMLAIPEILNHTHCCMMQAACALHREYPDEFQLTALHAYLENLLGRFQNKSLGDTVFRVGRDVYRKLGKDDRLIGAMRLAKKHDCACDAIASVVVAACYFQARGQHGVLFPGDRRFAQREIRHGMPHVLRHVCRLCPEDKIEAAVITEILRAAPHFTQQRKLVELQLL